MKRYIALMIALVALDQLFTALALAAFADGEQVAFGLFRIGRWDHAAPLSQFAPPMIIEIVGLAVLAPIFKFGIGGNLYQRFYLLITLVAAALITQSFDLAARGFAVNYVGITSEALNWWWTTKITDTGWEIARISTALLVVVGLGTALFRWISSQPHSIHTRS